MVTLNTAEEVYEFYKDKGIYNWLEKIPKGTNENGEKIMSVLMCSDILPSEYELAIESIQEKFDRENFWGCLAQDEEKN